jgi:TolB-like protein/DNA-binding winged helix-turn-helix (wHTH) protein
MMASRIHLTLLGGFEAKRSEGGTVTLPTRKAEALLAALACRIGETQLRERVIALLWGDRSDQQARHSLSQTLSSIRAAFDVGPIFTMEGEGVALDPNIVQADVVEFRRAANSDSIAELRQAADLYRGPLLEGFRLRDTGFEEWLVVERARLHDQAISLLTALAQRQAAAGDSDSAASALTRALALDPLAEDVHRRLIRLDLDREAYNAAIRHYRQCTDILKRELGTAPEPSTTALYHQAQRATGQSGEERATSSAGVQHPATRAASWDDGRPSIAVLPLVNMSGTAEQSYFSDGITEDIITELSRFRELFVVARNSSFRYRRNADTKQIAEELGVRFLVEGSVRRIGDRLRISVHLVEAPTEAQLWSEHFDRDVSDIFTVQDEVVQMIVAKVAGQLELAEARRVRRKRTENLAAYDCHLRGLASVHSDERKDLAQARTWFEKSTQLDPGYAAPLSMLAMVEALEGLYGRLNDQLDRAVTFANAAIALDPNDSWAHCALGYIHLKRRSRDMAAFYFRKAIRLNPNEPDHLALCALYHVATGHPNLALELMDKAELLNPCVPPWYLAHRAYALYVLRLYGDAAESFERQSPRPYWDTCFLAACYVRLERGGEARKCVTLAHDEVAELSVDMFAERAPTLEQAALDGLLDDLRHAGLPAGRKSR